MCNVSVSCHAMVGAKESLKNTKTIDLKSCFLDLHETTIEIWMQNIGYIKFISSFAWFMD